MIRKKLVALIIDLLITVSKERVVRVARNNYNRNYIFFIFIKM